MLSIIIVNYKNEQKTIDYIKEELPKITMPHKVVVVNNSATNESNEFLVNELDAVLVTDITKEIDTTKVNYVVAHTDNLGFAKGNNLGAKFSNNHFKAKYLLLSNNDIRFIDDNVVEHLVTKLNSLPNIGIIGPRVIGLKGESQSPEPYYSFRLRYFGRYWISPFLPMKLKNKYFKYDYFEQAKEGIHYKVMGSFFLVRTSDFMECGMMDPNTFLYAEEVILTERMKKINKQVYFDPTVTILHEHGATISKSASSKRMQRMQFDSESYYYKEYKNTPSIYIKMGFYSMLLYSFLKDKMSNE